MRPKVAAFTLDVCNNSDRTVQAGGVDVGHIVWGGKGAETTMLSGSGAESNSRDGRKKNGDKLKERN